MRRPFLLGRLMNRDRLWQRAQQHVAARRLDAAEASLRALLQAEPAHVHARLLLASVYLARGSRRDGCRETVLASAALPDDARVIATVATSLFRIGETVAARDCLRHPAVAACGDGDALMQLAHVHKQLGEHAQALVLVERARGNGYPSAEFHYFRGAQLQIAGELEQAAESFRAAIGARVTQGPAWYALLRMGQSTGDADLTSIDSALRQVAPDGADRVALAFARYLVLERLGRDAEAWQAIEHANTLAAARNRRQSPMEPRLADALESQAEPGFVRSDGERGAYGPQPIFIIGMPRSGTTLLEHLLGNHPRVSTSGELADFADQILWCADVHGKGLLDPLLPARLRDLDHAMLAERYLLQTQWRAADRPFFVDKMPTNFMFAGLIHKALPSAPILHLVRDPMDVCFSNYRMLFGDGGYAYPYALDSLADYYARYARLLARWHHAMPGVILDVDYAELVTDTEAVMRRVLAHCRLPFDAACLDVTANKNPVATLSNVQVRAGIHGHAVGAWRRYAAQLEPLRARLAQNGVAV